MATQNAQKVSETTNTNASEKKAGKRGRKTLAPLAVEALFLNVCSAAGIEVRSDDKVLTLVHHEDRDAPGKASGLVSVMAVDLADGNAEGIATFSSADLATFVRVSRTAFGAVIARLKADFDWTTKPVIGTKRAERLASMAKDDSEESAADATAPDATAPDATAPDATAPDASEAI